MGHARGTLHLCIVAFTGSIMDRLYGSSVGDVFSATIVYLDPILRLEVSIGDSLRVCLVQIFFQQIHYVTAEIRTK
jgi:hypothetical protein